LKSTRCPKTGNGIIVRRKKIPPIYLLVSVIYFKDSNLWFHGPTWLTSPDIWPVWQEKDTYVTMTTLIDPATKSKDTILPLSNIRFLDMSRFSSLTKQLRVTVLRFIFKCRGGSHTGRLDLLTTDELRRDEEMCIRCCKMSKYQAEIEDTKSKRNKSNNRDIKAYLCLFTCATTRTFY
jgi:hypothetical protein